MGMMNGFMTSWMVLWVLLTLALLVLAVVGSAWLVRNMTRGSRTSIGAAEDRLGQRYAAGEISRADYLQRRDDLTNRL